ncbi:hypothetical protein D3C78_1800260 [compost metagenome]
MIARIVDQRRTRIGYQRDVLPFFEFRHQRFGFLLLIMIVQSEQTGADREMLEQ